MTYVSTRLQNPHLGRKVRGTLGGARGLGRKVRGTLGGARGLGRKVPSTFGGKKYRRALASVRLWEKRRNGQPEARVDAELPAGVVAPRPQGLVGAHRLRMHFAGIDGRDVGQAQAELTFDPIHNSMQQIYDLYHAPNVITILE